MEQLTIKNDSLFYNFFTYMGQLTIKNDSLDHFFRYMTV